MVCSIVLDKSTLLLKFKLYLSNKLNSRSHSHNGRLCSKDNLYLALELYGFLFYLVRRCSSSFAHNSSKTSLTFKLSFFFTWDIHHCVDNIFTEVLFYIYDVQVVPEKLVHPIWKLPKNTLFCPIVNIFRKSNNINFKFFNDPRKVMQPRALNLKS